MTDAARTKIFQGILEKDAKENFNSIKKEVNPESNTLELDALRPFLDLYKKTCGLKDNVLKIITSHHLPERIMNDQLINNGNTGKSANTSFTEQQFADFITGKDVKSILFEKDIDGKRKEIEEIYSLYTLFGGDNDGISINNLNRAISKVIELYSNPAEYLRENFNPEEIKLNSKDEAEQIVNYLSQGKADKLSLEDFVNIMTSEFYADFDLMTLKNLGVNSN